MLLFVEKAIATYDKKRYMIKHPWFYGLIPRKSFKKFLWQIDLILCPRNLKKVSSNETSEEISHSFPT